MKKVQKTFYVAADGSEFIDENECVEYEKELAKLAETSFYKIGELKTAADGLKDSPSTRSLNYVVSVTNTIEAIGKKVEDTLSMNALDQDKSLREMLKVINDIVIGTRQLFKL